MTQNGVRKLLDALTAPERQSAYDAALSREGYELPDHSRFFIIEASRETVVRHPSGVSLIQRY